MAGAMKKMAVYLGLVDEGEPRYDDYDDQMDEYDRAVQQQTGRRTAESAAPASSAPTVTRVDRMDDRAPTRAVPVAAAPEQYRITTLHPRSYNDAKTIGLEYREGTPVIMNLTEMDDADAKRLVDFAAGLVFGKRGQIERITNKVFLLSPANVDVSDQARASIAEGGFFNQS
jgi:cell division inhibitor SepF